MENLKVVIITQARIGSSRFPAKILKKIGNIPLLSLHLQRLKQSKLSDAIVVATTYEHGVSKILEITDLENVLVSQGSTNDVLDRFYQAAKGYAPAYIVRVTSDCPLIDAALIDDVIKMTTEGKVDYGANILVEDFPDGQDVEVIHFDALKRAWKEASLDSEREHVTPFIRKNCDFNGGTRFSALNLKSPHQMNKIRMTVDEPDDLKTIEKLVKVLGTKARWNEYAEYISKHEDLFPNQNIKRNEGYLNSLSKENN